MIFAAGMGTRMGALTRDKPKALIPLNNIPIIENKPLARTMYKQLEVGQEIPTALYKAVAEILAIVMNIKKKQNYKR